MMNWLVSTSLRLRFAIAVLALVLIVVGFDVVRTTPMDVFPEFAPPLVEIQTEAPGLSTSEVEALVTVPLENALNGTSRLNTLRSKSVLGLSSVVLYFDEATDLMEARQLVQERLATVAGQLPAIAKPPVMLSPLSSTSRVLKIGMSSRALSQMELTTLARWTIRPRLMAIPGVANVAIWGERDRQIQVLVEPDRLRAHRVTLDEVVRAASDATTPVSGGFVDSPAQRLAVTHISGVSEPGDLAEVPVAFRKGVPLRLGDVADVVEGFPPPIGDAVINDGPGLLLIVEKQPWGNTLEVTRSVESALDALRPGLNFKESDFLMHWVGKPGASLEAMQRITVQVSRELRAIPGVRNFGSHIGRAEVADEVVGPNFAELWISIDPKSDYEPIVAQQVVDGYPGLYRDVLTYLKERIKEVLTGASATIVVRIFGPSLETLRAKGEEVAQAMSSIPGIADLRVEPQVLVPQIEIRLRPEAALRFGLTPGDVRRASATLVQGTKVGEIFEEQKIFDVVVRGIENVRADVQVLRELRIDTPSGGNLPLGDVADIHIAPTPNLIQREGASRRIDVTCNVRARDLGGVAREIEAKVRALSFERGYHPEFLGEYAAREQARKRLLAFGGLSLLGIFLILHSDFRSMRLALLVFITLPFALVGGVAAAFLAGGVLSLGSLVGFVTVLGIAARNGIMLVSHWRHLQSDEGVPFGPELVQRGAVERLTPILMTALATSLALLPIVVGGNRPGQEIEHPMAVVILGGLVTSTLLNLIFMPALYLRFGSPDRRVSSSL